MKNKDWVVANCHLLEWGYAAIWRESNVWICDALHYVVLNNGTVRECGKYSDAVAFIESEQHREPCEECGAVMTWRGDCWSHEDTATAATCYTAFRWGVK